MKSIETYRQQFARCEVDYPTQGRKELPQLIDQLADAYGHLNDIKKVEWLPVPDQQHLAFAMHKLNDALQQLGIDIKGYKF